MPEPKKCEYNLKYTSEYQPVWAREERVYLKKGIGIRGLARTDSETLPNIQNWPKIEKNIRQIPNEGVAISIRDDAIMLALIKSNVSMLIRDKPFIALMKELFEKYYESAKPIPKSL